MSTPTVMQPRWLWVVLALAVMIGVTVPPAAGGEVPEPRGRRVLLMAPSFPSVGDEVLAWARLGASTRSGQLQARRSGTHQWREVDRAMPERGSWYRLGSPAWRHRGSWDFRLKVGRRTSLTKTLRFRHARDDTFTPVTRDLPAEEHVAAYAASPVVASADLGTVVYGSGPRKRVSKARRWWLSRPGEAVIELTPPSGTEIGYLCDMSPDGRYLLWSDYWHYLRGDPPPDAYVLDLDTGEHQVVARPPDATGWGCGQLAGDGHRVAYGYSVGEDEARAALWDADPGGGAGHITTAPDPLAEENGTAYATVGGISDDGRFVVYAATSYGPDGGFLGAVPFRWDSETGVQVRLFPTYEWSSAVTLDADGDTIAYVYARHRLGRLAILHLPLDAGPDTAPVKQAIARSTHDKTQIRLGGLSPDGRAVGYTWFQDRPHLTEVIVARVSDGDRRSVVAAELADTDPDPEVWQLGPRGRSALITSGERLAAPRDRPGPTADLYRWHW